MTFAPPPTNLVLTGRPIHTFGSRRDVVEAVAIVDGVVAAAGSIAEAESVAGGDAARVAADGAILPGFCDTHMHFEKIAGELSMLDLSAAETIDDVLELVADAGGNASPGEWIQSFGDDNAWSEGQLRERRLPTREELDAAAPAHPVFLHRGPDAAALNSLAAALLQQALPTDETWDARTGRLSSATAKVLQETAVPVAGDLHELLGEASRRLLALGITTIVDPGLPARYDETWDLYREVRREARVLQRLYLMDRLEHRRSFDGELRRIETAATPRDQELDGVTGFGLKLIVDGEFDNAWMRPGEPQRALPARRYTQAEIELALRFCADRGWPICFHTMGGGAIDAVLDAVGSVGDGAFRRSQVTLAHGFLMSERNIDHAARLGVAVSVQPLLSYVYENEMQSAWGDIAQQANPYCAMLERGLDIAGGSDVLPCEPLRGAAVAVTRISRHGTRLGEDQAITPYDAISLFTRGGGAYLSIPELGTLDVGAPADFACWPTDPLDLEPEQWPELRPTFTAIAGTVVWRDTQQSSRSLSPKGALI